MKRDFNQILKTCRKGREVIIPKRGGDGVIRLAKEKCSGRERVAISSKNKVTCSKVINVIVEKTKLSVKVNN